MHAHTSKAATFLLALALLLGTQLAAAAVPRLLSYQGYLRDAANQPANGVIPMVFSLYDAPAALAALYTEPQDVSVSNGFYAVTIGSVTALTLQFDIQYYLGVAVGADPEMVPRQPLTSGAYSLRAAVADDVAADSVGTTQIADGAVTAGKLSANYAGSAIAGGPAATAVALAGNGTNCAVGEFARGIDAQGNAEDCTASTGGGTVTNIATGTGLTGGPITGSGTVSVAAGGITATELAANAVTTTKLADGTVTDAKIAALAAGKLTGVVAQANGGTGLGASGPAGNMLRSTGATWASAALQASDVPDLGGTYIRNTASQQAASFNISGNGLIGGNVGIGTVTPLANFHVAGSSYFQGGTTITGANGEGATITARRTGGDAFVAIDAAPTWQNSVLAFRKNNYNRWLMFANGTAESGLNEGSDFQLDAYNDAGNGIANYLFVKRSTGNVGIGTVNPNARLTLVGGTSWTNNGWVASMNLQNGAAFGWESNASGQRFGIGQTAGGLYFLRTNSEFKATASPANYDMQITDAGDVTFANKVTTNALRVNSGGFSFLTIGGSYQQAICRDITYGTLGQCASSLRFKSEVQDYSGGMDVISRLRPIAFVWNRGGERDIGFAAEEVFQAEPLLTTNDETGQIQGVKYGQFGALFVNAFKEQQAQIASLQDQLKAQSAEIGALKLLVCAQNPAAPACRPGM